jgi:hypothetical protein
MPQMSAFQIKAIAFQVAKSLFDGLFTNDKFCFIRNGRLKLNWWRKPLNKRERAYQQRNCTLLENQTIPGVYDEAATVECSEENNSQRRCSGKMGSSLSMPPEMGSKDKSQSGSGGAR